VRGRRGGGAGSAPRRGPPSGSGGPGRDAFAVPTAVGAVTAAQVAFPVFPFGTAPVVVSPLAFGSPAEQQSADRLFLALAGGAVDRLGLGAGADGGFARGVGRPRARGRGTGGRLPRRASGPARRG